MKIDDLKKEIKKMRAPQMDHTMADEGFAAFENFIQKLKRQDRQDERYLLRRIFPMLAGLILFTIVVAVTPIKHPVMLTGCILILLTLIMMLISFFKEYSNISKEAFGVTLLDFLRQKERRLVSWKSTPLKYHVIFSFYIIGVFMLILGNTAFLRELTSIQIAVYLGIYFLVFLVSWIIGERFYRKRHIAKHQPLLMIIEELKDNLRETCCRSDN